MEAVEKVEEAEGEARAYESTRIWRKYTIFGSFFW